MRLVLRSLLPVLALALNARAATPVTPEHLTIVLDFTGPHSTRSIQEMKNELHSILDGTGLELDWSSPEEASRINTENLVVVRFNGACILKPVPYLYDERGPLAFTHTSSGEPLPFSEVACNAVTANVRSAMSGADYKKADLLLGRALARVVAHEVVHMLTRSTAHSHTGIQKSALSGNELIEEHLTLSDPDLSRLQEDRQ
jgi:hypothetical protein